MIFSPCSARRRGRRKVEVTGPEATAAPPVSLTGAPPAPLRPRPSRPAAMLVGMSNTASARSSISSTLNPSRSTSSNGVNPDEERRRIGGRVAGQALVAAAPVDDDRAVLAARLLRAGRPQRAGAVQSTDATDARSRPVAWPPSSTGDDLPHIGVVPHRRTGFDHRQMPDVPEPTGCTPAGAFRRRRHRGHVRAERTRRPLHHKRPVQPTGGPRRPNRSGSAPTAPCPTVSSSTPACSRTPPT